MAHLRVIFLAILLSGCSNSENSKPLQSDDNAIGEYIYRLESDKQFEVPQPVKRVNGSYPWNSGDSDQLSKITKEYFRCKGSHLNPVKTAEQHGEMVRFYDCGGVQKHSLPLRDNKEFIYPILINVLNFIQTKTGNKVVITSGYRCPEHNAYVDPAPSNQVSKHMVGAEVSFYVQSMENKPEAIVKIIQDYFKSNPQYKDKKDFLEFKRYEKKDTDVSTQPWYNKEVFIKLYNKKEGRDFDNRHPYPYVSLQVRYDLEKGERVIYDWNTAFRNYLRY